MTTDHTNRPPTRVGEADGVTIDVEWMDENLWVALSPTGTPTAFGFELSEAQARLLGEGLLNALDYK